MPNFLNTKSVMRNHTGNKSMKISLEISEMRHPNYGWPFEEFCQTNDKIGTFFCGTDLVSYHQMYDDNMNHEKGYHMIFSDRYSTYCECLSKRTRLWIEFNGASFDEMLNTLLLIKDLYNYDINDMFFKIEDEYFQYLEVYVPETDEVQKELIPIMPDEYYQNCKLNF